MAFKKGQSGNPGGAWKEKPFREAIKMELAAAGDKAKALRGIARALIDKAAGGDIQAVKEIADRLDGKPAQSVNVTSGDDRDLADLSAAELAQRADAVLRRVEELAARVNDADHPGGPRRLN